MEILVTPEELLQKAGEIQEYVSKLSEHLARVEEDVYQTARFWSGDGNTAFIGAYNRNKNEISHIVQRFQTQAVKLQEMAGVYSGTEKKITESVMMLSGDIL